MNRKVQSFQFVPLAAGGYEFVADEVEYDEIEPSTPPQSYTIHKKFDTVEEVLAQIETWRNQIMLSQMRKCCGDLLAYMEEKG